MTQESAVVSYDELAEAYQQQIQHTNIVRIAYQERVNALEKQVASLRAVAEFYANSSNWHSPSRGFALQYEPELSPVQKDCGKRARDAIGALEDA